MKAEEILEYCCDYLDKSYKKLKKTKLGEEMIREIVFMLETN